MSRSKIDPNPGGRDEKSPRPTGTGIAIQDWLKQAASMLMAEDFSANRRLLMIADRIESLANGERNGLPGSG